MMKRHFPLAAALLLAACTMPPPPPSARLPNDAFAGAGDPIRTAIANTSSVFSSPRNLAGRPAQAAQAIAQMEFLAVELPNNPRFVSGPANLEPQLLEARQEWRTVLGIPPDVAAQPVINSLYAAARALQSGQDGAAIAALPADIFRQGGAATLQRLSALPSLPATNRAAVTARQVFERHQGMGSGRF